MKLLLQWLAASLADSGEGFGLEYHAWDDAVILELLGSERRNSPRRGRRTALEKLSGRWHYLKIGYGTPKIRSTKPKDKEGMRKKKTRSPNACPHANRK